MKKTFFKSAVLSAALLTSVTSCKKDNNEEEGGNTPTTPTQTTYEFTRDGQTSVSYSGQTTRLAQMKEIVSYMKDVAKGEVVITDNGDKLLGMINGEGFENADLNKTNSGKDLYSKINASEQAFFTYAHEQFVLSSASANVDATNNSAGVLTSRNGEKKFLVDANGVEWLQIIEKGGMGAIFLDQAIGNTGYSEKVKTDDNEVIIDGKNYTQMEHHFDEAFGYFGVPTDYPTKKADAFWGKYCDKQDDAYGLNSIVQDFINARVAIVTKDNASRDASIVEIKNKWGKLSAAQAVTYLNDYKNKFADDKASALHALAEGFAFVYDLKFIELSAQKLSSSQVTELLVKLGYNTGDYSIDFNNLSLKKVTEVIETLSSTYEL